MRSRLGRFCHAFKGRTVTSMEAYEIMDWIRSRAVSAQTQQNDRQVLHNFFNYAVLRNLIRQNPVKATPPIHGYFVNLMANPLFVGMLAI